MKKKAVYREVYERYYEIEGDNETEIEFIQQEFPHKIQMTEEDLVNAEWSIITSDWDSTQEDTFHHYRKVSWKDI